MELYYADQGQLSIANSITRPQSGLFSVSCCLFQHCQEAELTQETGQHMYMSNHRYYQIVNTQN